MFFKLLFTGNIEKCRRRGRALGKSVGKDEKDKERRVRSSQEKLENKR